MPVGQVIHFLALIGANVTVAALSQVSSILFSQEEVFPLDTLYVVDLLNPTSELVDYLDSR